MDLEQKKQLLQNWRGRRLLACRAADDLCAVVAALGIEDASELPPEGGPRPKPSEGMIAELQNSVVNVKRLILLINDGHVSRSKLNGF
jgi:hypothetical protein